MWWLGILIPAALIAVYIILSCIFLRHPALLHEKKKLSFEAKHISHRGGAGENAENTITAFKHAVDVGTHMLELDCHITLDKQIVVSHDNDLQRSTGEDILISETLFKDLPPLKHILRPTFQQDHEVVAKEDRKIPLLREVFEKFPETPMNIDIKYDDDDLIDEVSLLVGEFNRTKITLWGSMSQTITDKCFKKNPEIGLFFCIRRVIVCLVLYYTGVLPFVPLRESSYEIVMPSSMLRSGVFAGKMSRGFKVLLRVADWLLMSKRVFRHFRERGIEVFLWVLNNEEDFERAFQLGASGVMTDFPTRLAEYLDKKSNTIKPGATLYGTNG